MASIDNEIDSTPEYAKIVHKQIKAYEKRFLKSERKNNKYNARDCDAQQQQTSNESKLSDLDETNANERQPKITIRDRLVAEHVRDHTYALRYPTNMAINWYDNSPTDSETETIRRSPNKLLKAKKSIRMFDPVIEERNDEEIVAANDKPKTFDKAAYRNVYFGLNECANVKKVSQFYTRILSRGKCMYLCHYSPICQYSTRIYRSIVRHVHIKHMGVGDQKYYHKYYVNKFARYSCILDGCLFKTGLLTDIVKHVCFDHRNTDFGGFELTCGFDGCGKTFADRSMLDAHMRKHLSGFRWCDK